MSTTVTHKYSILAWISHISQTFLFLHHGGHWSRLVLPRIHRFKVRAQRLSLKPQTQFLPKKIAILCIIYFNYMPMQNSVLYKGFAEKYSICFALLNGLISMISNLTANGSRYFVHKTTCILEYAAQSPWERNGQRSHNESGTRQWQSSATCVVPTSKQCWEWLDYYSLVRQLGVERVNLGE